MSKAGEIRIAMQTAARLDREWMGQVPSPGLYTPWMPFSVPAFITLLAEAVTEVDERIDTPTFLEIGAGIGTKMLIAQTLFELDVHGIERTSEYIEQAAALELHIELADALGWKSYGDFDIIWFNRTFRDAGAQRALETQVWEDMKPGAIIMCANLEMPPPSSWLIVDDDWEARRGVWQKLPLPG